MAPPRPLHMVVAWKVRVHAAGGIWKEALAMGTHLALRVHTTLCHLSLDVRGP